MTKTYAAVDHVDVLIERASMLTTGTTAGFARGRPEPATFSGAGEGSREDTC